MKGVRFFLAKMVYKRVRGQLGSDLGVEPSLIKLCCDKLSHTVDDLINAPGVCFKFRGARGGVK